MKKYLQLCATFLLLTLVLSCNGQKKTDPPKANKPQTKQPETESPETESPEIDPYFAESKAITSRYGPNSITRNIIQDKKGDFWFATWQGIIHYNGMTFTNFTNKEGLRRFRVFSLLEDTAGNLWFGTIGAGVYRYDGKSFINFTTKDGLVNDKAGCFMEDKNGLLWIGTMGGISTYDGKSFNNFSIQGGRNNNDVNAIVEDNNANLWIGTRGDAFVYDGKSFTKLTTPNGKTFTNVRSIIKDNDGTMWLGGNDGLWSFDGDAFNNHSTEFTGYIYQDSEANIWTSSESAGNGRNWVLSKYDKKSMADSMQVKTEENMFFGITQDKKGGIWLGTAKGVSRYDGFRFGPFMRQSQLNPN